MAPDSDLPLQPLTPTGEDLSLPGLHPTSLPGEEGWSQGILGLVGIYGHPCTLWLGSVGFRRLRWPGLILPHLICLPQKA